MIRSMTGYGGRDLDVDGVTLSVEIRTVNHRHLDASIRLPRLFSSLESPLKKRLAGRFGRGKVDVTVSFPGNAAGRARLEFDRELVAQYREFAAELLGREEPVDLPVDRLIGLPGVSRLVEEEVSVDAVAAALEPALDAAADDVCAMRIREGEALEKDLQDRLSSVIELVEGLQARASDVAVTARARLRKRAEQLAEETGLLDEARLHQEVVLAADRSDITEELVRLRSHVDQFREVMAADDSEPVGRRLDFLLQEMMREANTVGSKAGDAPLAHLVVDLKTGLEQIREQAQNVE